MTGPTKNNQVLQIDIESKRYPSGTCALHDLHFSVAPGDFVAIVGPSGAGKSTLLKIIGGLDTHFAGRVQMPAETRFGTMFQEPRLMPWLTVRQNLQLVKPDLTAAQLKNLLADVRLDDCAELFPSQLSGGMQRRVALLRAFIVAPHILLMDEPFQSLDAPGAAQLRQQLIALWKQSEATVLFVTHSLTEALSLASRVLFFSGSPARIVLDYKVELANPRTIDSPEVVAMAQQLLQSHPNILGGSAGV